MSAADIPGAGSHHHLFTNSLEWFIKFRNPFGGGSFLSLLPPRAFSH